MRKTLLTVAAILAAACATTATTGDEGRTYSVYEYPDAKDKGTLPAYRVKEMPNGEVRVYKYGDPFTPAYTIRRDGKVFKPGDPFAPLGYIKNGLPATDKKGVK